MLFACGPSSFSSWRSVGSLRHEQKIRLPRCLHVLMCTKTPVSLLLSGWILLWVLLHWPHSHSVLFTMRRPACIFRGGTITTVSTARVHDRAETQANGFKASLFSFLVGGWDPPLNMARKVPHHSQKGSARDRKWHDCQAGASTQVSGATRTVWDSGRPVWQTATQGR